MLIGVCKQRVKRIGYICYFGIILRILNYFVLKIFLFQKFVVPLPPNPCAYARVFVVYVCTHQYNERKLIIRYV